MDICLGISNSTYYVLFENVHIAATAVFESVLAFVVSQENTINEDEEGVLYGPGIAD